MDETKPQREYEQSSGSSADHDHEKDVHDQEAQLAQRALQYDAAAGGIMGEEDGDGNLDGADDKRPPMSRMGTNKSSVPSVNNIKSVPNGGLRAWLQVLGAFFLFFNSWGIINTFGVYQTYYSSAFLASSSPSDVSWIGSVQAFLLMLVGALTGPIYDAGYFRALLIVGTFLIVLGQMMLSLATSYYQVFLAQAVCVGLGAGCLFVPAVAILSTYFSTKIATAMGIAASGSSLGGVIYPIVLYRLLPRIGFAWATRVLGFMMLGTLIVANAVMKVRVLPGARRKVLDLPAFKEPPYALFVIGSFFAFMGLYAPFFYIESYAIAYGITSTNLAFYTLPILNSASIFGRIIPNIIADRLGPVNVIIPCCFISGMLCLLLIPAKNEGGLIVLSLLYGFFSGALVSLPPTIFVHLSMKNRAMIGTRMGMGFAIISFGLLLGTPICGWILNASSFTYVWVWGGTLVCFGGFLILLGRMTMEGGRGLMTKL